MRIAIVTLPLLSNFGGILQNYALQVALKRLGHEPVTIDYDVSPSLLRHLLRCVKVFIKQGWHYKSPSRYKRNMYVAPFLEKHLCFTKRTKTYKAQELRGFDAYVVGSDQVWRYIYSKPVIKDVYLEFTQGLDCKRISYAASFGSSRLDYPQNLIPECRELIQKFDAISVREDTAVGICKDCFDVDAIQVIDPTFLNDASIYKELCEDIPEKRNILVAYVLDMNDEKKQIIRSIAEDKGLVPIILSEERQGGITIEEWLAYFRDASFVFTDSFHGTAFSIIFGKDFVTLDNAKRGSDRFTSLLKQFSLENRLTDISHAGEQPAIDWEMVERRKKDVSKFGFDFLNHSLAKY